MIDNIGYMQKKTTLAISMVGFCLIVFLSHQINLSWELCWRVWSKSNYVKADPSS